MIRPSLQEQILNRYFSLESDRLKYYLALYEVARDFYYSMQRDDMVAELDMYVFDNIELPLNARFPVIVEMYDKSRIYNRPKKSYTKIGDSIDYIEVTMWDIITILEDFRKWVNTRVLELAPLVRQTKML